MNTQKNIIISEEEMRRFLPEGFPVFIYESVGSTNTVAKEMAPEAAHGTTVIALHQDSGRGRLGRSFLAPANTGIYLSMILKPETAADKAVLITTAAAVAVCRALRSVCDVSPEIKWVNDVYVNGKKVCGILAEAAAGPDGQIDAVIVGIGINCSTEGFPEDLLEIAGAVEGNYSRNELAARVMTELLELSSDLDDAGFIDEYRRQSMVIGKTVKVYKGGYSPDAASISARVLDIDDNGGLQVLYSNGVQETLTSGEISIRL